MTTNATLPGNTPGEAWGSRVILTRQFNRYAGDHDYTISLVVVPACTNVVYYPCAYLVFEGDGAPQMRHITSSEEYIAWLFHNSMDLMRNANSERPGEDSFYWWWTDGVLDRQIRRKEFAKLLESFSV